MSKMKRALWFKDKFLLDDNTVWHVADVRWDMLPRFRKAWPNAPGRSSLCKLYMILGDMSPKGEEMWHEYNDKKRKSEYVVVASRDVGEG